MTARRAAVALIGATLLAACGADRVVDEGGRSAATTSSTATTEETSSGAASTERSPGSVVRPTEDSVGVQRLFITEDDDGTTFEVTPQAQVEVHLDTDGGWEVTADGDVVLVVAVSSFEEGGAATWEVRLERQGEAVLEARDAEGRTMRFTLVVTDG